MNNIMMMARLRELMVIFIHQRSIPEKAADALRFCQENIPEDQVSIGVYGEYLEIIEQVQFIADEQNHIAPDDMLSYAGEVMISILMLYERLGANIAIDDLMQHSRRFNH
ncbi:hypothetical protein CHU32_01080 [Superficieibacter electus]|uniref:Uncharacterized protein n=1 Tax=Superficieibacter electus TaxID=2022662 RepID=A0A2P5GW36_9ENTR|nr:hypothetical protein [Superficieibacter electus]POP47765.1 hypothetical protein CHU33_01075 [Superficieibacter electus]POP50778.1 hypothetical protein CHU32_01080 [Superficieibacter electus]